MKWEGRHLGRGGEGCAAARPGSCGRRGLGQAGLHAHEAGGELLYQAVQGQLQVLAVGTRVCICCSAQAQQLL